MFVRPVWITRSEEENYDLIDAHPWALLVNNGENGPFATNLPLLLNRSKGKLGHLIGHISLANFHSRALQIASTPALAIFEGPYCYVTSSWYPLRDMPPTYYYTAVHCYGRIVLQSEEELENSLEILVNRMESQYPNGWKTSEIDRSGITRRMKNILGFEMEIESIEAKFKLGQDEPRKDAMAVSAQLAKSSSPADRELAELIRQYNEGRAEP